MTNKKSASSRLRSNASAHHSQVPINRLSAGLRRTLQRSVFALGLLAASAAQASLGEGVASIYLAQQKLASSLTVETGKPFSVYTHRWPNGTVVREFLSMQDEVFAVVWQGSVWPNLEILLGTHYDNFATQMKQRRQGKVATDSTLVVESGGLMGALKGRIYLPAKLPAGVSLGEVK